MPVPLNYLVKPGWYQPSMHAEYASSKGRPEYRVDVRIQRSCDRCGREHRHRRLRDMRGKFDHHRYRLARHLPVRASRLWSSAPVVIHDNVWIGLGGCCAERGDHWSGHCRRGRQCGHAVLAPMVVAGGTRPGLFASYESKEGLGRAVEASAAAKRSLTSSAS